MSMKRLPAVLIPKDLVYCASQETDIRCNFWDQQNSPYLLTLDWKKHSWGCTSRSWSQSSNNWLPLCTSCDSWWGQEHWSQICRCFHGSKNLVECRSGPLVARSMFLAPRSIPDPLFLDWKENSWDCISHSWSQSWDNWHPLCKSCDS